jgi:hypothetical protein
MAERHREKSGRGKEGQKFSQGPGSVPGRDMHPDSAHQDQVEAERLTKKRVEAGKGIVHPPDLWVFRVLLGLRPHSRRRFDGDHFETQGRKTPGIAPGPRPDIKGCPSGFRQEGENPSLDRLESNGFISAGKVPGVGVVMGE